MADFLSELSWRGLLYQQTDGAPAALAAGPVSGYCGFDPTASSLHIGHLLPIMGLVHLQRAGHRPVALVGGGTGMIGDPSGKKAERTLLDEATVAANVAGVRGQLERFLDFSGARGATLRNNGEWLGPMTLIPFLRDVGKHFTVNYMLAKDSVRSRMEDGISYTEFTYMLLQAYDFLELNQREGVTLQIGGSDQWGNITAGTELVRRAGGADAHGVTMPLVTKADGSKFGKTEGGSVWLDASLTSPFRFYQFWVNADDRDVPKWIRYFTLLERAEVEELDRAVAERPETREAQRVLARDVTRRVHGDEALRAAEEVSGFLFGALAPAELSGAALRAMAAEMPFAEARRADLAPVENDAPVAGQVDVSRLLVTAGLAASNGAAKRLLEQGGISLNKRKLSAGDRRVPLAEVLLDGGHVVVGKGKQSYALVRILDQES